MRTINILENDKIKKIRICNEDWDVIILKPEILYKLITDLLLDEFNLFYFVTQKESTKNLADTKLYVKKLKDSGILKSQINDIFNNIGWTSDKIDIGNTRFQGDLAEYLMCILINNLTEYETLISKISFKTSPFMPSFGNDNFFYDYINEVLYYGESKFYSNVDDAIRKSLASLNKHFEDSEFSFVINHTSAFIAENNEIRYKIVEKFETLNINDVTIKSLSFIVNDDIYEKKSYEEVLLKKFKDIESVQNITKSNVFVFLPIISKDNLLKYFKERIDEYGK